MGCVRPIKVFFLIILCLNVKQTIQKAPKKLTTGLDVVSFVIDIASTGLAVADYMDQQDAGLTTEDLDRFRDEVVQKIEGLVTESGSTIITVINLQQKIARVTEIKAIIASSLVDLERYLMAETAQDKTDYKNLFVQRFEEHDAILLIRALSTLLTDTVPELSVPMSSLILDTTNCNMSSIIEFENFYANLISQGVTLEYAYAKITDLNLDLVDEDWDNRLTNIQNDFDDIESKCVDRFSASVTEEVKEAISLTDLHRNSNERYNWKWNDVYQYESRDTNSHTWNYFLSLQDPDFLFWNGPTQDQNKIIAFGDKNTSVEQWVKTDVQSELEANVSRFSKDMEGQKNAKFLGRTIGTFINDLNFVYKGIIILYVYMNAPASVIIDDQYSPAAQVYVPINSYEGYNVYVYPEIWYNFTLCRKVYYENGLDTTENCGVANANVDVRIAMLSFPIITMLVIRLIVLQS